MIKDKDEYLNNVMKKILNSYSIIENLSDRPIDLELLEVEVRKINGFLLVLSKKVISLGNNSSDTKNLEKKIIFYMQNYDFSREINLLLDTYSEDSLRVRNIRDSVLKSLNENELIQKIHDMSNNF
uniref:Uncharacterized protein n=1 Tax=uncultured marine thaumarchaeote KM3_87_H02 TaxID=1456331 RepID=A0A075HWD6_9ARCH|nr:hypothetical protein [uncultured marine thaumarchaeote KM3_87_H02]